MNAFVFAIACDHRKRDRQNKFTVFDIPKAKFAFCDWSMETSVSHRSGNSNTHPLEKHHLISFSDSHRIETVVICINNTGTRIACDCTVSFRTWWFFILADKPRGEVSVTALKRVVFCFLL